MASPDKLGADWDEEEIDLIVADHFAMLESERAGRAYVKSHHAAALMERVGRTHKSVEFKHQNISAVLAELGLPTIAGYKPKRHFQRSLIAGVQRRLVAQPGLVSAFDGLPAAADFADTPELMETPPPLPGGAPWADNLELGRLVRQFDPAERDARNRALGEAGEALVLEWERRRLRSLDRTDLADRVRWVSKQDGDGAGYDIRSFSRAGQERLIEVKTTRGSQTTPFFMTRNEYELGQERPDAFRLFRVFEFGASPRLFRLTPPLEQSVTLSAEVLRASFGATPLTPP